MTKHQKKVHPPVIFPGYTVATDADVAKTEKESLETEKGLICGEASVLGCSLSNRGKQRRITFGKACFAWFWCIL
jgi:hypothetical protein